MQQDHRRANAGLDSSNDASVRRRDLDVNGAVWPRCRHRIALVAERASRELLDHKAGQQPRTEREPVHDRTRRLMYFLATRSVMPQVIS